MLAAGDAEFEQSRGVVMPVEEAQRLAPRLHGEVGVVLKDRFVVAARAFIASLYVYTTAGVSLGVDWLLTEHFSVGLGVGLGFTGLMPHLPDQPPAFSVQVPFRVEYALLAREVTKVERSSFVFFLELSPGHEVFPPNLRRNFVGIGMFGVGWSWR